MAFNLRDLSSNPFGGKLKIDEKDKGLATKAKKFERDD